MQEKKKQKIVVIIGPTASGKTSMAVAVAQAFHGEIISADSRQVYRELNIGTEKITKEEMAGVPHHLIDCAPPETTYTAFDFKKDAGRHIKEIRERGNVPIIAGGTLFYMEMLLGKKNYAEIPPNPHLRSELETLPTTTLFAMLQKNDPRRAETIDARNPRRLVRALEIVEALGVVPKEKEKDSPYNAFLIGLSVPPDILKERIAMRLQETIEKGLVAETKMLLEKGMSETRLKEIGLEYRIVLAYLRGEIEESTLEQKLIDKVWHYAKRQRTWLKRMKEVTWYESSEKEKIIADVREFLRREH